METRISILSDFSNDLTSTVLTSSSNSESAWGQGTLSAKAIKALGDFVLRGTSQLIIRRRLSSMSSQIVHQTSGHESLEMYGMYSLSPYPISSTPSSSAVDWADTLELSRCGLYPDDVRRQALNAILMQLEVTDFRPIVEILAKWQPAEMGIFLFELMSCLPDERLDALTRRTLLHESIRSEYATSSAIRKEQLTRAFVRAVKLLALAGREAAKAVIDAGFFALMLFIVAAEGLSVSTREHNAGPNSSSCSSSYTLLECQETLNVLAIYHNQERERERLLLGPCPFILFWPKAKEFALPACYLSDALGSEYALPSKLPAEIWRLRLGSIDTLLASAHVGCSRAACKSNRGLETYVKTAFTEIVWLLCNSESDPSLRAHATSSLLKFIAHGPTRWKVLGELLAGCSSETVIFVFKRLIAALQSPYNAGLISEYLSLLPKNRSSKPDDYFLEFCTSVSRNHRTLISPLCESGIASVLLSVLSSMDEETYPHGFRGWDWNAHEDGNDDEEEDGNEDEEGNVISASTRTSSSRKKNIKRPESVPTSRTRKELLRSTMAMLSQNIHTQRRQNSNVMRILDVGVVVSVSLAMIEDTSSNDNGSEADPESDKLWKKATVDRLCPLVASTLRDVWTLLACQSHYHEESEAAPKRLLICFQMLTTLFHGLASATDGPDLNLGRGLSSRQTQSTHDHAGVPGSYPYAWCAASTEHDEDDEVEGAEKT